VDTERNNFLTEAILNCNHDYEDIERPYGYGEFDTILICSKCGKEKYHFIRFSTPDGFFKLWNWAKEQNWWEQFLIKHCQASQYTHIAIDIKYINPDRFANVIYEFLKEQKSEQ
jgi:hypothetical protein